MNDRNNLPLPPLLGIGGAFGAGKDAVADVLVDNGWTKTFMSKPMSAALYTLNPWIPIDSRFLFFFKRRKWVRYADFVDEVGYTDAKLNEEVRSLLQLLGTEVGRNMLGENIWADMVRREIIETRAAGTPVVMTGARYPNELTLIRELGGELVWVDRPAPSISTTGTAKTSSHSSEGATSASDFDIVILNDGSLADLATKSVALGEESKRKASQA